MCCVSWGSVRSVSRFHQRAVALNPSLARSHVGLGDAQFELRQIDEAETSYRRALELQPAQPQARVSLAIALRMQGRFTAAQAECETALGEDAACIEALCLLGELHADGGSSRKRASSSSG